MKSIKTEKHIWCEK